jgi:uridine kinase
LLQILSKEQHEQALKNEYNFDHPNAFDFELILKTLQELKKGKQVRIPIYNFETHSREKNYQTVYGANVIIFEGSYRELFFHALINSVTQELWHSLINSCWI